MDALHLLGLVLIFLLVLQFSIQYKPNAELFVLQKKETFCHPYESFGFLSNHAWHPWDPPCVFRLESLDIFSSLVQNAGKKEQERPLWMQNKTILFVGDSLEREALDLFCQKVKWQWYAGSFPNGLHWTDCHEDASCPHICHDPEFNITLVNFFLFGIEPDPTVLKPFLTSTNVLNHTLDPRKRLETYYFPYYKKLNLPDPDLLFLHSGILDLWQLLVTKEKAAQFFDRFVRVFDSELAQPLIKNFPKSTLYVRSCGSVIDYDKDSYSKVHVLQNESLSLDDTSIQALNTELTMSLQHSKANWFDYYKVTKGDLKWENPLHPSERGLLVFINMWLYELKHLNQE